MLRLRLAGNSGVIATAGTIHDEVVQAVPSVRGWFSGTMSTRFGAGVRSIVDGLEREFQH